MSSSTASVVHPAGEVVFNFPTYGGNVRLCPTDDALTPFGGLVPWAAFQKQSGLLEEPAATCPVARTSPNAAPDYDVLASFGLTVLCDGRRFAQYTGALLRPDEGSLDHVVPRSRGGPDTWENLVWSSKQVNTRKGNRLPHEAGLKLLKVPRAPKELPVSAIIRNAHGVAEWKLFLNK
jgi:hypothetical protein